MWPFDCPAHEREIASLRAHIQDLSDLQLKERESMIAERKDLLEKIMALTQPAALRETRRVPQSEGEAPQSIRSAVRLTPTWPGFRRDTRPPDPESKN